MSSYVKRAMQANEHVLYATQLHWIIYQTGAVFVILGVFLAFWAKPLIDFMGFDGEIAQVILKATRYGSIGIIALGALQLFFSFIRQTATELVITDRRVISKHGLISTTSYELMLTKVEGTTIEQTVMGRILGYGTLIVKGTGGDTSPIDHIANPYLFHAHLMTAIKIAQDPSFERHGAHD